MAPPSDRSSPRTATGCRGLPGIVAALVLLSPVATAGQAADTLDERFSTYLGLVERYRSGVRDEAVRKLGTWGPVWIRWGVDELLRRGERADWADIRDWVRTAQGAFLLHVATAMYGHEGEFLRGDHDDHIHAALRLLRWFGDRKEQPEEARGLRPRDFYLALASVELLAGRPNEADSLAEESLESYDRDVMMWLLVACTADMKVRRSRGGRPSDEDLQNAGDRFRRVLALDPENEAGRLRLGWILVRRGRFDEARPLLEAAARRPLDEDRRFLSLLFLGAVYEGLGNPRAAVEAYRQATKSAPHVQAGQVALARTLERVAGERAARAVVQSFVAKQARSWVRGDPWDEFHFGPPELRMRPFDSLVQRLCPR
jgi:Tfp pilus assembly protein PilF